jgi:hypothetical protein
MGIKEKQTMKTHRNTIKRTEYVGSTTPRIQPDTRQPLAILLSMAPGVDEVPDFFADRRIEGFSEVSPLNRVVYGLYTVGSMGLFNTAMKIAGLQGNPS